MFGMGDGWFGGGTPILSTEETIDKYLEAIKKNLLNKEASIERLRKEIDTVKDEKYASEEMQKMKEERDEAVHALYRGFPISDSEWDMIHTWQKKHDTEQHRNPNGYHGVSGGGYSFEFYPTAIGTSGVCKCSTCNRVAMIRACAHGEFDRNIYNSQMKEMDAEFEFQEIG